MKRLNILKKRTKNKLLNIQNDINDLKVFTNKINLLVQERDENFLEIVKSLSKIMKIDLEKLLEQDRAVFYKTVNVIWTVRDSLLWIEDKLNTCVERFEIE